MKISILLPYKENYASNKAGAVSLFVNDITKKSVYKKTTKIFGNTIYKKFLSSNYVNLKFDKNIFLSSNNQYANYFINYKEILNSDLIEVHNRPNYIKIIKRKYQNRLFLYYYLIKKILFPIMLVLYHCLLMILQKIAFIRELQKFLVIQYIKSFCLRTISILLLIRRYFLVLIISM